MTAAAAGFISVASLKASGTMRALSARLPAPDGPRMHPFPALITTAA